MRGTMSSREGCRGTTVGLDMDMGTGSVVYFCGTMKPFLIIMFLAVFGLNCHAGWRKKDPFLAHADLQDLVVEFL